MKAKELITIFELSSQILSHYKNKEVVSILSDILDMCKASSNEKVKKQDAIVKKDIQMQKIDKVDFLNDVSSLTLDEIREKLNDRLHYPSVESLRNLAVSVGLSKQSRANKDNIIHSILKVIERSRIDKTISERHDEI
ncbi:hypothetical protein Q4540_00470 [Pseudoalteromonas carrageenovora]|uniref:hypothetical protein n=1 Tax=Pseudoalteromonas TaxID=53246 RepID=UPI0026E229B8|nr:hypothetical protein [Pseudoalteromonas carrageenovora]MDO6636028.1 hypothetical protein [Pseudoalteromonas carrageenovora]MDO6646953.1 hypothetical protein [Pseudoalteromonas carrageenovora]